MTDRSSAPFHQDASRTEVPGRSPSVAAAHPSSPAHPPRSRASMQIGLSAMLLLVVIAAVISAGLVYAARIPEIQEELSVIFGTEVTADRSRRAPQILFILFTFTSPLLLAMVLSIGTLVWNALISQSEPNRGAGENDPAKSDRNFDPRRRVANR